MGANNVLPNVPAFTAGSPTIAQLNALSYAVSFLTDYDVRPIWKLFMYNGTQSLTASAWNNVAFDHIAVDSDGVAVSSKSTPTIVTEGYYALEACVEIQATGATSDMFHAAFLLTAGPNNPNKGTTQYFGYASSRLSSTAQAAADNAMCIASITPMYCYPGDTLNVAVYPSAAHTLDYNVNTSYIQGRFATVFTGRWLNAGWDTGSNVADESAALITDEAGNDII